MSLNKTLDRFFDEIRREAKRNPEFADRLDAVLRLHDSRRDVADETLEDVAKGAPPVSSPASGEGGERQRAGGGKAAGKRATPPHQSAAPAARPHAGEQTAPSLNPAGLFRREGEDALTAALAALDEPALRGLIVEHNLDPADETAAMAEPELAAHIVAQAKRRAERDDKMFDY